MKLINQRSINRSLNPLLLGLLISTLTACYEELDLESLCHPLSSNCAEKDFDGDGVINRLDEFPIDPSCSKNDHQNCGRCGNACGVDAFCNIDQECEAIKAELCNGRDDDGNQLVDDNKALAKNQVGVCQGSLRICVNGKEEDADYQKISGYEEVEGLCDGLDNDCDGTVDENLRDIPLTNNQIGVCEGALKVCQGRMGYLDQYDQISGYLIEDTSCDGLDNDCDGKLDESVDLMLLEKQLGICQGLREVCALAEGIVIDYEQSEDYQEVETKCDGLDNDCDGVVDEELLDIPLTTNQVGVCMNALKSCDGANGFVDHYQLLATYQEIEGKCDGLDNDCDGVVDEELLDIPLTTNQVGVCMNALKSCDGANGFVDRYQLLAAYQEIEGRCDGLDNDCDGVVDETLLDVPLTTNQTGVCMNALKSCDGANGFVDHYQLLATYQEIEGQCDGLDNDCDGVVDEELIDIPLTTNQVGVCMNALKSCDGANGFVDQYRLIVNYESLEVSCDRQDNDCDGRIDEGIFGCCGNGTIDDGEECDDNNVSNTDGCLMSCQNASCGDGFIQEEVEQCDDGNNVNTDACTNSCNSARCGDGIVQLEVEACDDGNSVNTDACISCAVARCGDGFVLAGSEQCDDGNSVNTDSCTNACNLARCGDGFVQMGEACDDGNSLNTDSCTNACNLARCGDGFVQAGEACDDGNINNRDNCSNSCFITCDANCPAMEMILIQAGSFNMGSNTSTYEQPIHNVQIRSNFYVGKTEVTVGQYRACVNAGQCTEPNTSSSRCNWTSSIGTKETHPVNCVDWNQARTFAKWIGGDLLTEAQWEYVATGQGQAITYPWGNAAPTCQLANHVYFNGTYYSYCVVVGSTAPVCSTTGGNTTQDVCDMGGNVWEWVLDEYHGSYSGAPSDDIGWCSDRGCESNTSELRINRGGGWDYEALYLRSARRNHSSPGDRHESLGFRVSRSIP